MIVIAFIIFAFVVALLLIRSVAKKKDPSDSYGGTIGIATKFFQVLAVIGKLDVLWPKSVSSSISVVTTPFSLKFTDTLAPECSIPAIGYEAKWALTMLLPVFFAIVYGLIYLGAFVRARITRNPEHFDDSFTNRVINAYLSLLSLGFLSLASTALEPFGCKQEVDLSWTLVADPSLVCFAPWWNKIYGPAAFGVLVYVIGLPALLFWWLRKNRSKLTDSEFTERYGSLYSTYVPSVAYWESIVMAEKVTIAALGIFFNQFVMFQIIALQALFMFTVSLYQQHRPYIRSEDNRLHSLLRWCSLLVLFAGNIFKAGQFPAEWARKAVEVSAIVFIAAGAAIILGSVGFNLLRIRRALRIILDKGLINHMKAFSPHGRLVVARWLRKTPTIGWQERLKRVLESFEAFCEAGKSYRHDPIADTVALAFTRGVFRDDLAPNVRSWFESSEPKDRDLFVECFTDLGVVDTTSSHSREDLHRITRTAIIRSLEAGKRHDDALNPRPLELMKMLYGDALPRTATDELCRDPDWLMAVNALYLASLKSQMLDYVAEERERGASVFSIVSPFGVVVDVGDELDEPPPTPTIRLGLGVRHQGDGTATEAVGIGEDYSEGVRDWTSESSSGEFVSNEG